MTTGRRGLLAAPILLAARVAAAQDAFPSRPLRLVVPYPPGGAADMVTRLAAQGAARPLGQPVVVENRPGANGLIGAANVAAAPPDGHALLVATDGLYAINPHLLPPGAPDPVARLEPVIQFVSGPLLILGRPGLPATTLAELVALARREPDALTYGANNVNSAHYLITQMLQRIAGIRLRHIAYAGTSAALPDLLGGRIDLLIGQPASSEMQGLGALRRIAITSAARFPTLPDVPAVAETFPGFDQGVTFGVMAPAGTPARAVAALNAAFDEALREPATRDRILASGSIPVGGDAARFRAFITAQRETFGRLVAELGLRG